MPIPNLWIFLVFDDSTFLGKIKINEPLLLITISKTSKNKWFSWKNWPKKIDGTLENSLTFWNFKNHVIVSKLVIWEILKTNE